MSSRRTEDAIGSRYEITMRKLLLLVLVLVSCKSKEPPASGGSAAAGSGSAVATGSGSAGSAATGSGAGSGSAAVVAHIAAANKAEKAKDWKTATTELDAAVALAPDDARTLAELTWAAYFAKQLDHARDVGVRAVLAARAAKLPKVEAMALFNLGLAVADIDVHAARSLYKASLDLRPNKTVTKKLAAADEARPATPAGDAILAKLAVTRIEENRKLPETPQDSKLLAALQATGLDWDMAAGHGAIKVDLTCTVADAKCTIASGYEGGPTGTPPTADQAKALIAALQLEGIKPKAGKLAAKIDCLTMDEGLPDGFEPGDSCDVTPL